ncbi:hypothetical protein BU24DRAFT_8990 [Aaosphaeria arxii CBS 175.79]|uniref:Galactose oxidase n=1 Tax=Aaosphaeria arxii CBS 175.79 TaxID=1450172 RepID=A0A6A5Y5N3_9PLEO|nr:uncharacterized protein BU24DRAFT_8990 [Aaosphaeria arxii CBS 175.79]KAF2020818.1 hypothetical protein BU24DRAFT_8990 [Aaosphaeria arxii CBS 175.79]
MMPLTLRVLGLQSLLTTLLFTGLLPWTTILVQAQKDKFALDPVKNFCSRYFSQSVVKDDMLYIDSGIQKWNGPDIKTDAENPVFGINNYILKVPMKTSWDWKTDMVIIAEPKNETSPTTGTLPPSLMHGHIFHGPPNNSQIYIYGGTTYMGNRSFPSFTNPLSSTYSLWTYDDKAAGYPWEQHDISQPWKANHGAAAEAIDQGLGFYLNGQIDWGTSVKTLGGPEEEALYMPLEGMLIIDLVKSTSVNISTRGLQGDAPRVGGTMEYIAPIGAAGILIALGGQVNPDKPFANSSEGALIDFGKVDIFDIDSYLKAPGTNGKWYQQETIGDIPPARADFCSVIMSAPDNSSHHIYVYGGLDPTSGIGYDDVHVLTIPSFQWTTIYNDGGSPRFGHKCHIVGKRQMITVGGLITNSGQCDWEEKGVAFYDLTTTRWGSVFTPDTTAYGVPQQALQATGGKSQGGATVREPVMGWTDTALKSVFDTPRGASKGSGGSKSDGDETPGINIVAIAGGAGGGFALVLLAAMLLIWQRRRDAAAKTGPQELENSERSIPPSSPSPPPSIESDPEKERYELQGIIGNVPVELPGPEHMDRKSAVGPKSIYEADWMTATKAVELSSDALAAGGVAGIPLLRLPGNDSLMSPFYFHGPASPLPDPTSPPPEYSDRYHQESSSTSHPQQEGRPLRYPVEKEQVIPPSNPRSRDGTYEEQETTWI